MNIIVCVKQVPDTEARVELNETKIGIKENGLKFSVNPCDEFAVEEAIRIKEKFGGEIIIITLGPERAKETLRTCLALGADKAIHLKISSSTTLGVNDLDSLLTASILADAIRKIPFDIVLCGNKAIDTDNGVTGIMLAEILGIPAVSVITKLEIDAAGFRLAEAASATQAGKKAVCRRQIESGEEIIECDLPALFTCQKGLNVLRYPTLPDIMRAKNKPIETKIISNQSEKRLEIVKMTLPIQKRDGEFLTGESFEQVKKLVEILKSKGVIGV